MAPSRTTTCVNKGFTIVELLVALVIMTLMTSVLLSKYPETVVRVGLTTSSTNLGLLVREAQLRGSAIDSVQSAIGGYGVFLSRASSSQAIVFGDIIDPSIPTPAGIGVGNGVYESAPINEMKTIDRLKSGYTYEKLCVGSSTAPLYLAPYGFICNESYDPDIQNLTISFSRPSPFAHIYINNSTSTDFSSACVQVYSPKTPAEGHIRSLVVYHYGMVVSSASPCDND